MNMIGKKLVNVFIVEKENMRNVEEKHISIIQIKPVNAVVDI